MNPANGRPRLATVTVAYNEPDKLGSWRKYYEAVRDEIDLHIIVDDGSATDYFKAVQAAFPESILLSNPVNRGLIASYNVGFQYALRVEAQYIGTFAPDFRLLPGTMRMLCRALDATPDIDGIMPVVLKSGTNEVIESLGARLDSRRAALVPYTKHARWNSDWTGIQPVDTMHGGCHLLRRTVLERIGLQNERMFMYADEVDFGWRAKQAGLKFGVLLNALAWHEHVNSGGATRPAMAAYLVSRNRMLVMRSYGSTASFLMLAAVRGLMLVPAMVGYYRREGTLRHAWAYALGLFHGILGVTGPPPKFLL
jgi:hypothetical protein